MSRSCALSSAAAAFSVIGTEQPSFLLTTQEFLSASFLAPANFKGNFFFCCDLSPFVTLAGTGADGFVGASFPSCGTFFPVKAFDAIPSIEGFCTTTDESMCSGLVPFTNFGAPICKDGACSRALSLED